MTKGHGKNGDGGKWPGSFREVGCGHDHAHGQGHGQGHDHGQGHAHDHGHAHDGHSHDHALGHHHSTISNLKLALFLNLGFSLLEIAGGFWTGSYAVLSNAIHDLSDALAIAIAYVMERMGGKESNSRFSYGYRRYSLLSALVTCAFLIAASCVVLARAIPLLLHPERPKVEGMLAFAVLGVVVNGYAAWRLSRGRSLNEQVVTWHMIEDVLSWVTVLLGSAVMLFVDLPIIDPILCIVSSLFILWGVSRSLRRTLVLFLQATPEGVDLAALRRDIEALDGVQGTHDAHLWSLDGQSHVLTIHVVVAETTSLAGMEEIKGRVRATVARIGQTHVTVEMEAAGGDCPTVDCVKGD